MKNPIHSIRFKIWKTMIMTIGLFLLTILIINVTIISQYKKDISFKQLEAAAAFKYSHDREDISKDDNNEVILISHFALIFKDTTAIMQVDTFTQSMYPGKEGEEILKAIASHISTSSKDNTKGQLSINKTSYFYYLKWLETDTKAMVFFAPKSDDDKGFTLILLLFLGLMIISFFTSNHVAKKLAKPIQELEFFAEEIAKRNWSAPLPITDPDEIGLLADSLAHMRDALKIAEERDRQFLQSTSHDLKTPVMIIKGYAQALIDGVHIDSEQSVASIIKKETERLERRITQLLRLNTLGHSLEYANERNDVSIDRILKNLIQRFRVLAPQLEWDVELHPFEILGDAEALLIAFENLLDNQLRYGKSRISIKILKEKNTIILIENDGAKFSVEDPMILFDPHKKDATGKFGLGLAIVHQVIKSHQGDIVAFNTDKGVCFKITFNT